MNLAQSILMFLLIQFGTEVLSIENTKHSLLCCRELSSSEVSQFSFALEYKKRRQLSPTHKRHHATTTQLLLILSGTVEINPGPVKFPCGDCGKAVKNNAIACDSCHQWYHQNCISMSNDMLDTYSHHDYLEWTCTNCALIDISLSAFDDNTTTEGGEELHEPVYLKKPKQLRIFSCNFQSIWNKKAELSRVLAEKDIDILIGSETHLSCNIQTSEILPSNYTASRKDRNDGHGGVIIIYKKQFIVEEIKHPNAEIITVKLETHEKPVIISSCYRSPNNSQADNALLTNEIQKTCNKYKNYPIWIAGDFNLPDIEWGNKSITGHQNSLELNEQYLELFDTTCLSQIVDFTTRLNSTLDLLLTNRCGLLISCQATPGLVTMTLPY